MKLLFSRTMSVRWIISYQNECTVVQLRLRYGKVTSAIVFLVLGLRFPADCGFKGFVRIFIGHVARLRQNKALRIGLICRLIVQSADDSNGTIGEGRTEARHKRSSTDWKMKGELRLQRAVSQACSTPFYFILSFCITSTVYFTFGCNILLLQRQLL